MQRRTVLALLLACAAGFRTGPAQTAPLTVFIVRHTEKGPEVRDPSLTNAGRRRATELARVLGDVGVNALFVTQFRRTQETLAPLARRTGLTPTLLDARDVDGLIEALGALPPGSRAVVASHSNLVHLIVARLTGVQIPELTDVDYDRLVVVTVISKEQGTAVVLHYGER